MGTGVEIPIAEELIGSEIGGSFLGDAFAGDALGSVITDAGVGGSFLGDTAGASMLGNIGGASSLLGNIGGYGIGNLMNPSALGAYNGLEATSGLGIGNISNAAGIPMGSLNNLAGYTQSLNPSGIFANAPGQSLTGIQSVGNLTGVGNVITPTQELLSAGTPNFTPVNYEVPNGFEFKPASLEVPVNEGVRTYNDAGEFVGYEKSAVTPTSLNTPNLTGIDDLGQVGIRPDYINLQPGFVDNLNTALNPFDSAGASQRLEALKNVGSKAFDTLFINKSTGDLNIPNTLAALSLYPTYAAAKAKAGQIGVPFSESDYQAGKIAPSRQKYATMAPKSAFGITTAANGGRIKFGTGGMSDNRISQLIQLLRDADAKGDQDMVDQIKLDLYRETRKATGGRIGHKDGKLVLDEGPANKATRLQMEKAAREAQKRYADMKTQDKLMDENYKRIAPYESLKDLKILYDMAPEEGYSPMPEPTPPEGVLSIRLTPAQQKAHGGMINHPIRRLAGGISELDLRAKGGFIPMGVKEKADDVPAMLSKNEFVFTADAVRNAGGGSINKGAQKMYKLMKSLENKKVNRRTN